MNFERPPRKHVYIEVAPLVDVVFLLLLFFVLSYNMADESAIDVLLPPSSEADQPVPDGLIIAILADGDVFLNDVSYPLQELAALLRSLREADGGQTVCIHADQRLEVLRLMKVVDAVRASGCTSFSIVTRIDE
ncbi:ExbD/TolR family protein [Desulfococcus sp.]|uniref:ExbD/TolR family protein n=1 Tax=Desulfococcus sp. TaxID=2025834 RepID=UPI00359469FF